MQTTNERNGGWGELYGQLEGLPRGREKEKEDEEEEAEEEEVVVVSEKACRYLIIIIIIMMMDYAYYYCSMCACTCTRQIQEGPIQQVALPRPDHALWVAWRPQPTQPNSTARLRRGGGVGVVACLLAATVGRLQGGRREKKEKRTK